MKPYKTKSRVQAKPTRWISGHRFNLVDTAYKKDIAKDLASTLRKQGKLVRVIHHKKYVAIYARDPHSKQ